MTEHKFYFAALLLIRIRVNLKNYINSKNKDKD